MFENFNVRISTGFNKYYQYLTPVPYCYNNDNKTTARRQELLLLDTIVVRWRASNDVTIN